MKCAIVRYNYFRFSRRCGALIEMYPTAITASLSYFRSQNPLLRRNVIILLAEILTYIQSSDSESLGEETLAEVVAGMTSLLRDQDRDVRRTAAEHLGRVMLVGMSN